MTDVLRSARDDLLRHLESHGYNPASDVTNDVISNLSIDDPADAINEEIHRQRAAWPTVDALTRETDELREYNTVVGEEMANTLRMRGHIHIQLQGIASRLCELMSHAKSHQKHVQSVAESKPEVMAVTNALTTLALTKPGNIQPPTGDKQRDITYDVIESVRVYSADVSNTSGSRERDVTSARQFTSHIIPGSPSSDVTDTATGPNDVNVLKNDGCKRDIVCDRVRVNQDTVETLTQTPDVHVVTPEVGVNHGTIPANLPDSAHVKTGSDATSRDGSAGDAVITGDTCQGHTRLEVIRDDLQHDLQYRNQEVCNDDKDVKQDDDVSDDDEVSDDDVYSSSSNETESESGDSSSSGGGSDSSSESGSDSEGADSDDSDTSAGSEDEAGDTEVVHLVLKPSGPDI